MTHDVSITSFFGSLRMVRCSCGWGVGCHTDRKALRLAEEHRAPPQDDGAIAEGEGGQKEGEG